jgi:hypothetical protein
MSGSRWLTLIGQQPASGAALVRLICHLALRYNAMCLEGQ